MNVGDDKVSGGQPAMKWKRIRCVLLLSVADKNRFAGTQKRKHSDDEIECFPNNLSNLSWHNNVPFKLLSHLMMISLLVDYDRDEKSCWRQFVLFAPVFAPVFVEIVWRADSDVNAEWKCFAVTN